MAVATTIRPLTAARWPDLEALFRGHGNPGYCWCMRWRAAARTFTDLGSRGRHDALRSAVERRIPTGVLAYRRGARLVEAYPVGPEAVSYRWMGTPELFLGAGFTDVSPPGWTRRVMRRLA
ncbi:MAG: hypothetical protein ACXWYQ_00195 [Actinomycetota bacterium]